jgi:dsDNA-specific endonuclease/ATPase MutS2
MFSSKENYKSPKSVKLGEDVEIVSMHQVGTVVSLPDAKGDFLVKVGIMKLKTNLKDVRSKKEETTEKKKKQYISSGNTFSNLALVSLKSIFTVLSKYVAAYLL